MKWRIYYGGGSTFSSEDGAPVDAPRRNIQCIVRVDEEVGRYIERMDNFYVWCSDRENWKGVDRFGLYDYMLYEKHTVILFGRTITEKEYKAIYDRAVNDSGMLRKSAMSTHERKP
jgi:hypothetical protein